MTEHHYILAGAITAPVVDPHFDAVIGMATIYPDGRIEAQIHAEMFTTVTRNLLTANLAEGLIITAKLRPAQPREEEEHDRNSNP